LNPKCKRGEGEIKRGFRVIFEQSLKDAAEHNLKSPIYRDFLSFRPAYAKKAKPAEMARDYIASLTDKKFSEVLTQIEKSPREKSSSSFGFNLAPAWSNCLQIAGWLYQMAASSAVS